MLDPSFPWDAKWHYVWDPPIVVTREGSFRIQLRPLGMTGVADMGERDAWANYEQFPMIVRGAYRYMLSEVCQTHTRQRRN